MRELLANLMILCATSLFAGEVVKLIPQEPTKIDSIIKKAELIPIMVNGDKDNRINIVIMNRWRANEKEPYNTPARREEFVKDIKESLIAALTPGDKRAQTAFANYRSYFNVYGLWWPDEPEWGNGVDLKEVDAIRDKLFLPWKNEFTGWVTFLVMPNSASGGGGAARNLENRVGNAVIAGNGIAKMLHEISHTCMSIGDEYTTQASGTSAKPTYNSTLEYRRDKIKWRKWISPDTPLPTPYTKEYFNQVGAFEGSQYHLVGYFSPTAQGCIMSPGVFDTTEKLCPICEQRLTMRVYTLVNPISSFSPADTELTINKPTKYHFKIDHITPTPNTQVVRWKLNGKLIASGVDEIDIKLGAIREYEMVCSLTDETPFIRPDPPYAKYPERNIRWKISNTSPTSASADLKAELSVQAMDEIKSRFEIKPRISGGKPPYSYQWSTGSTDASLKNVGPGIYDLVVVDSEYRKTEVHLPLNAVGETTKTIGKGSKAIQTTSATANVSVDVTAAVKGLDNGKIAVSVTGGKGPWKFAWDDRQYHFGKVRIYEAEQAKVNIPGHKVRDYFNAGNGAFVDFAGQEGSISWSVEVANSGVYPAEIIFAGIAGRERTMKIAVNGMAEGKTIAFGETRPLNIGWEKATIPVQLKQGVNTIELTSTGASGPNVDYLTVPSNAALSMITASERINLQPGEYAVEVTDNENNTMRKTVTVSEEYPFHSGKLKVEKAGPGTLRIADPLPGYIYKWYTEDASPYCPEHYEKPLAVGSEFNPPKPGNYYIAAQSRLTNAESSNRFGLAVDQKNDGKNSKELSPALLNEERIKLWLDASDLDGDGEEDSLYPPRGPFLDWKEKTWRNPGKLFIKYEPNKLNGKGICAFDHVWVTNLGKEIKGFQTIIMVYRESSLTLPGNSPFKAFGKYIGKSSDPEKRLFDRDKVDEKTKNGSTYLNGKKVDPFSTPHPMKFCILTVELGSRANEVINTTEGLWEGSVAEILVFDQPLSENERTGIEEYLRMKWFSSFDLNF